MGIPSEIQWSEPREVRSFRAILLRSALLLGNPSQDQWSEPREMRSFSGILLRRCALSGQSFSSSVVRTEGIALFQGNSSQEVGS